MENITNKKIFKISKYTITFGLILASIFTLMISWYSAKVWDITGGLFQAKPIGVSDLRTSALVLGFLGFIIAILSLTNNKNPNASMTTGILALLFLVALIVVPTLIVQDIDYTVVVVKG